MIDQVKDGILLIINDALGERLAFHGECAGDCLPNDVGGLPRANLECNAAGVNAEVKGKVAQRSDPWGPKKADLSGRAPDGGGR